MEFIGVDVLFIILENLNIVERIICQRVNKFIRYYIRKKWKKEIKFARKTFGIVTKYRNKYLVLVPKEIWEIEENKIFLEKQKAFPFEGYKEYNLNSYELIIIYIFKQFPIPTVGVLEPNLSKEFILEHLPLLQNSTSPCGGNHSFIYSFYGEFKSSITGGIFYRFQDKYKYINTDTSNIIESHSQNVFFLTEETILKDQGDDVKCIIEDISIEEIDDILEHYNCIDPKGGNWNTWIGTFEKMFNEFCKTLEHDFPWNPRFRRIELKKKQ